MEKDKLRVQKRIFLTGLFTLITLAFIGWDYFHEGVPMHYILHDDSLPGFSNWLGLIIIPVLTSLCLWRMSIRTKDSIQLMIYRFLLAFLFATAISITFSLGLEAPSYLMLATFILAFFFPFFKSEFLLGYVMGSLFVFGAFIPTVAGLILIGVYYCLFHIGVWIKRLLMTKTA